MVKEMGTKEVGTSNPKELLQFQLQEKDIKIEQMQKTINDLKSIMHNMQSLIMIMPIAHAKPSQLEVHTIDKPEDVMLLEVGRSNP